MMKNYDEVLESEKRALVQLVKENFYPDPKGRPEKSILL